MRSAPQRQQFVSALRSPTRLIIIFFKYTDTDNRPAEMKHQHHHHRCLCLGIAQICMRLAWRTAFAPAGLPVGHIAPSHLGWYGAAGAGKFIPIKSRHLYKFVQFVRMGCRKLYAHRAATLAIVPHTHTRMQIYTYMCVGEDGVELNLHLSHIVHIDYT